MWVLERKGLGEEGAEECTKGYSAEETAKESYPSFVGRSKWQESPREEASEDGAKKKSKGIHTPDNDKEPKHESGSCWVREDEEEGQGKS